LTPICTDVLALFGLCALAPALALDGSLRNNHLGWRATNDLSTVIDKVIVLGAESPNHLIELLDLRCMRRCADEAATVEACVDLWAKVLRFLPNVRKIAEVMAPPWGRDGVYTGRHPKEKSGCTEESSGDSSCRRVTLFKR